MNPQEMCVVCSSLQAFEYSSGDARDDGICATCGARLKERDAAHFILGHSTLGQCSSIKDVVDNMQSGTPRIVEFAYNSALSRQMNSHPSYEQKYFWLSGRTEKTSAGHEIPFCDLHDTGFSDASKDIVVTNDALSFVENLPRVIAEMGRVIRIGGVFIAINKIDWPLPNKTVELPNSEAKMYRVPDGMMPLRRKIGADLRQIFSDNGFRLLLRQTGFTQSGKRNFSAVGVKL